MVKQPLRAMRSLVTACTARTAATAARVGTLMSNGLSSPAPREIADSLTGFDIKDASRGKVPSAAAADTAVKAGHAKLIRRA